MKSDLNRSHGRVALLIPYYGKWPVFFPHFLKSLEGQELLEVFIFSDIKGHPPLPANVSLIDLPFETLKSKMEVLFNKKIGNWSPYKLCDFKPFFGLLFSDYIEGYKYWAYGDLDIIYGNLHKFLSPALNSEYDIITFRRCYISGALTVLRNSEQIKQMGFLSDSIDKLFVDRYVGFDEAGGKMGECRKWTKAYNLFDIDRLTCWTSIVQKQADAGNISLYAEDYYLKESLPYGSMLSIKPRSVQMFGGHDDYIAFHLVYHKKQPEFTIPVWKKIPDEYMVCSEGFFHKPNATWPISVFIIRRLRRIVGRVIRIKKRLFDSIIYRFGLGA